MVVGGFGAAVLSALKIPSGQPLMHVQMRLTGTTTNGQEKERQEKENIPKNNQHGQKHTKRTTQKRKHEPKPPTNHHNKKLQQKTTTKTRTAPPKKKTKLYSFLPRVRAVSSSTKRHLYFGFGGVASTGGCFRFGAPWGWLHHQHFPVLPLSFPVAVHGSRCCILRCLLPDVGWGRSTGTVVAAVVFHLKNSYSVKKRTSQ